MTVPNVRLAYHNSSKDLAPRMPWTLRVEGSKFFWCLLVSATSFLIDC